MFVGSRGDCLRGPRSSWRRIATTVIGAGLAVLLAASPVTATTKGTSVWNVYLLVGPWGGYTNFFADWSRTLQHSEGQTYWSFDYLDMSGGVLNGMFCGSNEGCDDWPGKFFYAQMRNASGSVVTTITPPSGACVAQTWPQNTRLYRTCKQNFEVPATVTQIKFYWSISVDQSHFPNATLAWLANKTVAI